MHILSWYCCPVENCPSNGSCWAEICADCQKSLFIAARWSQPASTTTTTTTTTTSIIIASILIPTQYLLLPIVSFNNFPTTSISVSKRISSYNTHHNDITYLCISGCLFYQVWMQLVLSRTTFESEQEQVSYLPWAAYCLPTCLPATPISPDPSCSDAWSPTVYLKFTKLTLGPWNTCNLNWQPTSWPLSLCLGLGLYHQWKWFAVNSRPPASNTVQCILQVF